MFSYLFFQQLIEENMQINKRVTKQAWQNQLRQFFQETERETQFNGYIPPR